MKKADTKDLGSDETFLNEHDMDQIWLPPLIFSNTVGNMPILSDVPIIVKILKQGAYVHKKIIDLHEGTLFHGNENDLQLDGQYETIFKCLFKLKCHYGLYGKFVMVRACVFEKMMSPCFRKRQFP